MLLAAEGQLLSVSRIARDPLASAMSAEAARYPINTGLAEEIYLMQPDLVVAGAYSSPSTLEMLRRLDVPVAVFDTAKSLDDVRARIRQMGEVLHREAAATRMVAAFDARLAAVQAGISERPRAVLYYANGYTLGDQTLAGHILAAAGFENAAAEVGYSSGARMPLEVLALLAPEIVITARDYPGASRSEEILSHPVVQHYWRTGNVAASSDHDWLCGTPFVARAVENLAATRRDLIGGRP